MSVSFMDIVLSCVVVGLVTYGISVVIAYCFPSQAMLAREALDKKISLSRFRRAITHRRSRSRGT
jgi:hypothetical protein